jgi:hypothetical protein
MTRIKTRALFLVAGLAGCGDNIIPCDSEPTVRETVDGVEFVRTPDVSTHERGGVHL